MIKPSFDTTKTQCATPDQHFASTDLDNGLANIMNDIAIQVRATMMRLSK